MMDPLRILYLLFGLSLGFLGTSAVYVLAAGIRERRKRSARRAYRNRTAAAAGRGAAPADQNE